MNPLPPFRIMRACDLARALFFDLSNDQWQNDTGLRARTALGLKRHLAKFPDDPNIYAVDANENLVEIDKHGALWVPPWRPPTHTSKQK